jgi:hypothetical protein
VWFTAGAIAAWRAEPRTGRGGQPRYSGLAVATALTLRAVFRLALRQTEGLVASIVGLFGLDLAVPDHSTLSRRAETLAVPRRGREGAAHDDVVHLLRRDTGPLHGVADGVAGQRLARGVAEGAAIRLADRGAGRSDDDRLAHPVPS